MVTTRIKKNGDRECNLREVPRNYRQGRWREEVQKESVVCKKYIDFTSLESREHLYSSTPIHPPLYSKLEEVD